jgi:hypothetical protein
LLLLHTKTCLSRGIKVERISFDEQAWTATQKKLKQFYSRYMVAEYYTQRVKGDVALYT